MAYFEFHDTLPDHPKTAVFARAIGVSLPTAVGHVACLLAWTIRLAPAGLVPRAAIRIACRYEGKRDIEAALIESGFAHKCPEGIEIHDWSDYTKAYRRCATERQRLRNKRATVADASPTVGVNGTEQNKEQNRAEHATPTNAVRGLVMAFHFCKSPGIQAKTAALEDLLRQGVEVGKIMSTATDPGKRTWDFYAIIKSIRPNGQHGKKSLDDQLKAWVAKGDKNATQQTAGDGKSQADSGPF